MRDITDYSNQANRAAEENRKENNKDEAQRISLPFMEKFSKQYEVKVEVKEKSPLDYEGVDYVITIKDNEPIPCSFRLIKGSKQKFYLRYSGGFGGFSEARKIATGTTKAQVYITLELETKTLRFYKINDIKRWLTKAPRELRNGSDGSRYYTIPFSDLVPLKEIVVA